MSSSFCPHCMAEQPGQFDICPYCGQDVNTVSEPHQLPVGCILTDHVGHRFLIGSVMGEGGFGITYIGKELYSGVVVAIKEYFPKRCNAQRSSQYAVYPFTGAEENFRCGMKSFLNEASMLRAISTIPSCVKVLEYFEANGTAYMIMEFLEGETLANYIAKNGPMRYAELMPKLRILIHDMSQLHQAGVIHRDIAPDNIIMQKDGSLKLLDFGCARSMEDGRSMTVMLKPGFAPVEQYQTKGQGPYTDLYALCATIYYCMTGVTPVSSPDRMNAIFSEQPDPLVPPSALGADLSSDLERALMWGLTLQPSARPQNMEAFAEKFIKESWVAPSKIISWIPVKSPFDVPKDEHSGAVADIQSQTSEEKNVSQSEQNQGNVPTFLEKYGQMMLIGSTLVLIGILVCLLFA